MSGFANAAGFDISIHTVDGRRIGDIPCAASPKVNFGREIREVSGCDFSIHTESDPELVEELRPWLHWITVWDGSTSVWTGPIQKIIPSVGISEVNAKDVATFMWRTRIPKTKAWLELDPAEIAVELWVAMLDHHGIKATPSTNIKVSGHKFTYNVTADSKMIYQAMDDLVKLGLEWSVVAGTPVLGKVSTDPVTRLAECDFLAQISRIRDGSNLFNNVRVQGKNFAQTVKVPLGDLDLQSLISLDDLQGVSNIQRASLQEAEASATLTDLLAIPAGASLHPQAPVMLSDLVPGAHFVVDAQGLTSVVKLDQLAVSTTPTKYEVQVTLQTVIAPTELGILTGGVTP